ncbi:Protein Gp5, N-terminal OB-fold domain containing protein [uncultured Caudovirales phage]|uniref:Protein Gp5, N-terminal OB-fold domain containing protein n=1 Tax=uncultured Caudovirales phage TaxID=2100421 RepID=A0A6J5QFD1_9CAUD|nr:Protein Gp5, N-terminal OB-fold domain containing protein [uncultured Caudovirales phage]
MTEASLGSSFSWWIAKVVNVKDPDQSGRVQVRIFGKHDDEKNIPDKDLPWAMPLQPVTSPAIGKLGTAPLGLVKDSKVMGFWADSDQQYPIIMGSFGKAGDPKPGSSSDGAETIDIKTGSIPSAAVNQSDPVEYNAFSKLYPDRIDINKINNQGADPTVGKFTISTGIVNKKEVDTKLKEPTKPTTASVDKTSKTDVMDLVKQVDPEKKSRALPNAIDGFNSVRNIINLTSAVGLTKMLAGSLEKSLGGIAALIGAGAALGIMGKVLESGTLDNISKDALKLAMVGIALSAAANQGKVPQQRNTYVVPKVNPLIGIPILALISATIPPTHVQQYHELDREPYPGYIQYKDVQTGTILYRKRRNDEYHFPNAQDHIQYNTSTILQVAIGAAVVGKVADALLGKGNAIADISKAITGGLGNITNMGIASILGQGMNPLNMVSMAGKLIPNIAGNVQSMVNGNLPKSALNVSKVGPAMSDFTKNQALLAQKKAGMKTALKPDIDSQLAAAQKKLADSQNAKNVTGTSEIINGQKVTYTATGATVSKV